VTESSTDPSESGYTWEYTWEVRALTEERDGQILEATDGAKVAAEDPNAQQRIATPLALEEPECAEAIMSERGTQSETPRLPLQ